MEKIEKNDLVTLEMISANCNCNLNSIDYSPKYGDFAFSSSNLIHIYNLKLQKTEMTLKGHALNSRINTVKFLKERITPSLISVGSDGCISLWSKEECNGIYSKFYDIQLKDSINVMDCLYISETEIYVICFTGNSLLNFYLIKH